MTKKKKVRILTYFVLILGLILILFPLYITIVTAFKTNIQTAKSFFTPPLPATMENVWVILTSKEYWSAFKNTAYITVFVLLGNMIIMPAMSYAIASGSTIFSCWVSSFRFR